jgi:hypothetical protein
LTTLRRAEIVKAWRIRKLLDQAADQPGTPEGRAYAGRAEDLAGRYPLGRAVVAQWRKEPGHA